MSEKIFVKIKWVILQVTTFSKKEATILLILFLEYMRQGLHIKKKPKYSVIDLKQNHWLFLRLGSYT